MREVLHKALSITPRYVQRRIWVIAFSSAALALFDSALVVAVGPIVEGFINKRAVSLFGLEVDLLVVTGCVATVLIAKNVLQIALARWKQSVLFRFQAHLSSEALGTVLDSDFRRATALDPGKKSSYVITEPLQLVLNVYANGISYVAELSLVLVITASLLAVNTKETLALFGTLIVLVGGFQWATREWLRISGVHRRDADTKRHDIVRAVVDSEIDVRAMKWQKAVKTIYEKPNSSSSMMVANKAFATEIVKNVVELAVILGVGLLALLSASSGTENLAALLATFGAAAYRLAPSFNRLLVCGQSIRFGLPSLDAVHELLATHRQPSECQSGSDQSREDLQEMRVEIDALTSPSGAVLVRNTCLHLVKGDILVVCGPSGIGKSTLIKALIDGSPGVRVTINGVPLKGGLADAGLDLGMIGQRALVLPASLADNILPGHSGRADSAINEDATRHIICSLADHHKGSVIDRNTVLSNLEEAVHVSSLSGGQAQRIALMRAAIFGRDCLLLDEPTSALDARARDRFMELILTLSQTRIVIIVSHDPKLESFATKTLQLRAAA